MEQLIVMKQRIKAVETIKKVTHAMRLISMSSHTRLLGKKKSLTAYKETFESLWSSVHRELPPIKEEPTRGTPKHLIVLASSQKGLCGTFNTTLFKFFEKQHPKLNRNIHLIGIGKYAVEYLRRRKATQIAAYPQFTPEKFVQVAQAVTDLIVSGPIRYASVTVYSNKEKTFFVQQPQETLVYPLSVPEVSESDTSYLFEQSPKLLRSTLSNLLISVSLQDLLFDSLLAEQAARFISMDSSTRNADNLLTTMRLDYNKVRQAAITRELTELSATL